MVGFSVESVVRVFIKSVRKELLCRNDPFAVAVIDATSSTMGHDVLLLKKSFSTVETFEFAASIEEDCTHCARAYITRDR